MPTLPALRLDAWGENSSDGFRWSARALGQGVHETGFSLGAFCEGAKMYASVKESQGQRLVVLWGGVRALFQGELEGHTGTALKGALNRGKLPESITRSQQTVFDVSQAGRQA